MLRNLFVPASVKLYQRYRASLMPLHQKIIEAHVDDAILGKAARALKLGSKRQLVLDHEDDLSVLMDYGLYEIKVKGRNLVQRYQQEKGEQSNELERELLVAMVKAQTGLFRVQQVNPGQGQVVVHELTGDRRHITLTDVNFSRTLLTGVVLFFRALETRQFTMTSGVAFAFMAAKEERLLQWWAHWEATERYAGYFRMSKQYGIETHYQ